jgi:hypothetical protein
VTAVHATVCVFCENQFGMTVKRLVI